jgi:hypothetical protein
MPRLRILLITLLTLWTQLLQAGTVDSALVCRQDLPVLCISTVGSEEPSCDYVFAPEGAFGISTANCTKVPGRAVMYEKGEKVFDTGNYEKSVSGMTIRIRGNTSAYYYSKKPYKIKLQQKADMLCRSDSRYYDKDWALLADGDTDIKTLIGLKVSQLMGLWWTPACRMVNLIINGNYRGVYLLIETVDRNADCRINVDKHSGFIIERDAYWWNENVYFKSTGGKEFTFKYPDEEDVTAEQLAYISQYVEDMEHAIAEGTYADYIDVGSFAAWLMAHDILGTYDSGGANLYLTKNDSTADSKLSMSTLWDFGSIMKADDQMARIRYNSFFYYNQLFNHKNFADTYQELYNSKSAYIFTELIKYLNSFTDEEIAAVDESRRLDAQRWDYTAVSMNDNIKEAVTWFTKRQEWMNGQFMTKVNSQLYQSATRQAFYTIWGQKTGNRLPTKPGIYISNGKKYTVK